MTGVGRFQLRPGTESPKHAHGLHPRSVAAIHVRGRIAHIPEIRRRNAQRPGNFQRAIRGGKEQEGTLSASA